ncbi:MAG: hypothetical protein ACQEUB_14415, partial [Thermodesulfobacteriota bacterium]
TPALTVSSLMIAFQKSKFLLFHPLCSPLFLCSALNQRLPHVFKNVGCLLDGEHIVIDLLTQHDPQGVQGLDPHVVRVLIDQLLPLGLRLRIVAVVFFGQGRERDEQNYEGDNEFSKYVVMISACPEHEVSISSGFGGKVSIREKKGKGGRPKGR